MKPLTKTAFVAYLLTFFLPWLSVYDVLTWGGPFEESEAGKIFTGWALLGRYWLVFLLLAALVGLVIYTKKRWLFWLTALYVIVALLYLVTFGDSLNVTVADYVQIFRHYSFSYIKLGYFLHALASAFALRQLYREL